MSKNYLLILAVLFGSYAHAQKNNRASAIDEYKSAKSFIEAGDQVNGRLKLISAAKFTDLAQENSQTSNDFQTLKAMGDIYLELNKSLSTLDLLASVDAAVKSKEGYFRALKSTSKSGDLKSIDDQLRILQFNTYNQAIKAYSATNFNVANNLFIVSMEMAESRGEVDPQQLYATGMSCEMLRDYGKALTFYQKCADLDYGDVSLYTSMVNCALLSEDFEGMEAFIVIGLKKFPTDQTFLVAVANAYLMSEKNDRAAIILERILINDPKNQTYLFTLGSVYEQMGEVAKAEEKYLAAIKIDPNYFEPNFNLGAIAYNMATDIQRVINMADYDTPTDPSMLQKMKEHFQNSRKHLEMAHSIKPDDISTLRSLTTVYMQLEMMDQYKIAKAKLDQLKSGK